MRTDHALAAIGQRLGELLGGTFPSAPESCVHGGSINESYRWKTPRGGAVFIKAAPAGRLPMFEAEAAGLAELASARALRVPSVLACGVAGPYAFLALDWIDFGDTPGTGQAKLGAQLAKLHRKVAERFGWSRDNTIGSTAQINAWCDEWVTFFRERRLRHQLELARANGIGSARLVERGERLLEKLEELLAGHRPAPSLLHGDLWGGNAGVDSGGAPVIFDPAVYYGDRETDLAMTRLFGGFSPQFYAAYEDAWPLPESARERVDLYNLYHVLNHANLFGGGYARQAEQMIDRLLAR